MSLNTCQGIKQFFMTMFLEDASEKFSLSPRKAFYLITDTLYTYFHDILLNDINGEHDCALVLLHFDETKNNRNKKEWQVRVIYWSYSEGVVVNIHLVTKFIKRGDCDTFTIK